jgi:O-antigen/teichoic acid export membrane protein
MNLKKLLIQKYQNNKELSKSFIWRLIQILSKQGTSGLMFFIATYFLTKEEMGIYGYVSSILLMLVIFSDFGISISTSRYITLYNTTQKEKVNKVFFNSLLIILTVSVVVVSTVLILKESIFPRHLEYIYYALPLVLITPLTSVLDGIYRGLKKFKKLATVSLCNSVLGITISYILVTNFQLKGAILAQAVYFGIYAIILFILQKGYEFKIEKKIIKDIGKYSMYFGIASLGHYFFSKVNVLILGGYNLLEEIAVYELLNKVYTIFLIPFSVLGQVLAPNIVEMFSLKKYRDVKGIFKRILSYMLLLNIVFIPVSMIVARFGISTLFPIYSDGILMALLLPVTLTFSVAIPVVVINTGIITSTGHAKLMAIQNVVSGTVNVILNILIVREYGYVGVIWVTFAIQLLSTLFLYIIYYSKISKL